MKRKFVEVKAKVGENRLERFDLELGGSKYQQNSQILWLYLQILRSVVKNGFVKRLCYLFERNKNEDGKTQKGDKLKKVPYQQLIGQQFLSN